MKFKELGLNETLLKAIAAKGYTTPSPIQEKAIPQILKGRDILASAQTGTGKTAGFALPIIQLLSQNKHNQGKIKTLVLTPTRELAAQVFEEFESYSKFTSLKYCVIFGGVNQNPQVNLLKKGVDVLIATPGRLMDLKNQGFVSFDHIEFLVLDEADRMLDMGFLRDIQKILKMMPEKRQNLLFSATFSKEIKALAKTILNDPIAVEVNPENASSDLVNQTFYRCDAKRKVELVTKLIWDNNWHQVLVFTRTKHGANRLADKLNKANITAATIHGNKSQTARTKALSDFKNKDVSVLVATDIAARGLDIPLLPYVINFEIPNVPEDYVHRIGRTGRAGANGQAISLISGEEFSLVHGIEKLMGISCKMEILEGFEPTSGPVPGGKKRQKENQTRPQTAQPKPENHSKGNANSKFKRRFRSKSVAKTV